MLKQSKRIHGRLVLKRILDEGTSKAGPFLNVITLENTLGHTRYAALVGKKLARTAVVRNHKRRQIYEIIRLLEKNKIICEDQNLDIVLIARSATMKSDFTTLYRGLEKELTFLQASL
ncbi:ribonuclease P protein component [Candidatus Peregrinibacteria bacterium]|nr:MAG: ribonuclease P protein component [Candidatus Peregrinibacteria bacterium]